MFAKICVFLLLGIAYVAANPVQDSTENELLINEVRVRGILGTVQSWLVKADDAISGVFDRVTAPFKKVVQLVVETGEGVLDYSKEKFEQLMYKYYEIKSKSEANLNEIKNSFILKVVSELQNVIDVLSKQADADTFEKLKNKTQEIAESSKEALEKLQLQLQQAIEAEKQKLEQNLDEWKQQADKATKKRST